jgi:hypothetical protein
LFALLLLSPFVGTRDEQVVLLCKSIKIIQTRDRTRVAMKSLVISIRQDWLRSRLHQLRHLRRENLFRQVTQSQLHTLHRSNRRRLQRGGLRSPFSLRIRHELLYLKTSRWCQGWHIAVARIGKAGIMSSHNRGKICRWPNLWMRI